LTSPQPELGDSSIRDDFMTSSLASSLSGSGAGAGIPSMIGDSIIGGGMLTHMGSGASQDSATSLYSFHVFKIAEDESPIPRNRILFDVNSYSNVPGTNDVTRFMLGFEKTFFEDMMSLGLRLPIWTADIERTPTSGPSEIPFGPAGDNADLGDMIFTLKTLLIDCDNRILSAGVSVTAPTGPDTLADVDPYYTFDNVSHRGAIQPWLGWYRDLPAECFGQGFAAFDLPFDSDDADYFYLDLGIGHRVNRQGFISAITPMVEAHWSAPMNDKAQPFSLTPLGTSVLSPLGLVTSLANKTLSYRHQVNITSGLVFELDRVRTLTLAIVIPTVGPRPMDAEVVAQCNCFAW
jgi:hypothetical protein